MRILHAVRTVAGAVLAVGLGAVADEPTRPSRGVSAEQLARIMPQAEDRGRRYLSEINRAMAEFAINTPRRQAAFLAQIAHESGELRYMEEIASGEAYEGRRDLGNTQPGDGRRYKGRGPIQLTGRDNYRRAGRALGLDLEGHPEQAARPEVGFRIAGWFWKTRRLNELADQDNFREITRKINPRLRHYEQRLEYYQRARRELNVGR